MFNYLLYKLDGLEVGHGVGVSHPESLPQPEPGWAWAQTPGPPWEYTVSVSGGVATVSRIQPSTEDALEAAKRAKAADVDRTLATRFALGFIVSGTGTTMDGERLQVRNAEDRTNWLTSMALYQDAVGAGQGDTAGAKFRTASNSQFTVTFAQGLSVLSAMGAWGFSLMEASWQLKDAIRGSTDAATLAAVDTAIGWPD